MPQSKDEDRSESAEPDAMKVARPVLNGGDEETCPKGKCALSLPNPWSDGTTGIRLSPVELLEKLAALVPLPRVHLVRYGGCLAPHSHLRGAIIPTPRQQGVEEQEDSTASPRWRWARLLQRVFAVDMARCPWCQRGAADDRRHHAGRSDQQNPPPSETCCRPTAHHACPFPPSPM
jgi:Putative transposase